MRIVQDVHCCQWRSNGLEQPPPSMGIDIPLAVLSEKHQPLFNYFKQLLRPGHQPAHRRHPGEDRHRYHRLCGLRRQSAGGEGGELPRAADQQSHFHQSWICSRSKPCNRPGFTGDTVSLLYYKNTSCETGAGAAVRPGGPGLPGTAPTSSSSPTGAWMKTMWPSRRCWRYPQCSSI